jgi:hypothetical protein
MNEQGIVPCDASGIYWRSYVLAETACFSPCPGRNSPRQLRGFLSAFGYGERADVREQSAICGELPPEPRAEKFSARRRRRRMFTFAGIWRQVYDHGPRFQANASYG